MVMLLPTLFKPTPTLFIPLHFTTHIVKNYIFTPTILLHHKQPPSHFFYVSSQTETNKPLPLPMPPKPKIIAEYAKSSRSACKVCSNKIQDKSLRLGLMSKDPRGYDSTKWFHLTCFSDPIQSTDFIQGFGSLKESDKEALEKFVDELKSSEQNGKRKESELEENDAKKTKLSVASKETNLDIAFSPSDCKDKYKDAELMPKWKAFQTIIFLERDDGLCDSRKIAAFDFDGCLAKTDVRRVGADSWSLMHSSIPNKLQSLHNDGYKLVIFTNESNIDRWKNKRQVAVDSKIGRLNSFISLVEVPIQVFISCGYSDAKVVDPFRKPKPGMWRIMEKHFNSGIPIDMDQSFYVGDAAGRQQDHSDADKKFAEAIGVKFYVPEDYFGF